MKSPCLMGRGGRDGRIVLFAGAKWLTPSLLADAALNDKPLSSPSPPRRGTRKGRYRSKGACQSPRDDTCPTAGSVQQVPPVPFLPCVHPEKVPRALERLPVPSCLLGRPSPARAAPPALRTLGKNPACHQTPPHRHLPCPSTQSVPFGLHSPSVTPLRTLESPVPHRTAPPAPTSLTPRTARPSRRLSIPYLCLLHPK
jgi:hypothetical protein